jgi:hypothetical protein
VISLPSLLSVTHLVGLALGVGSATVKLVLLLKCSADDTFAPVYIKVARPITRQIILGLGLLTLSGIGWLLLRYPFRPCSSSKSSSSRLFGCWARSSTMSSSRNS